MRIYLAQINPTVGDLHGNVQQLLEHLNRAKASKCNLFIAPELCITGYPPRDLLDRPAFLKDSCNALTTFANQVCGIEAIVGSVIAVPSQQTAHSPQISNGAVYIRNQTIVDSHRKLLLPTYDVFDEARYFTPGTSCTVLSMGNLSMGITICEDIWNDKDCWQSSRYNHNPVENCIQQGAQIIINLSASPYEKGKAVKRKKMLSEQARKYGVPFIYVNQVGGNDSILFDGRSSAVNQAGEIICEGPSFAPGSLVVQLDGGNLTAVTNHPSLQAPIHLETWEDEAIEALSMGLRDYTRKCGFTKVVIGLSGGIDSALTAALAVHALGPENVRGITMPSRYSSQGASDDAHELGKRLGIKVDTIAIEPMFQAFLQALEPTFEDNQATITQENLQARIRGNLLMAYSNNFGALLLTTGNKSEMAVGYCTLYGDMCGGLAVISDVYKTDVYAISERLNARMPERPIPQSTLTKPPSAELRPDQKDEDSLPPYPVLDFILRNYIDEAKSIDELIQAGQEPQILQEIISLVDRNEYKRRQAPPGLRISHKAFGEGRRLPIAQKYQSTAVKEL